MPTNAGWEFLAYARQILEELDSAVSRTKSHGKGVGGRLIVGFYTSLSRGNLLTVLAEQSRRFPETELTIMKGARTYLLSEDQVKFDRFVSTASGREDSVDTDTLNRANGKTTAQDAHAFKWRAGLNYVFDNGIAPYVSYATSFQPASGVDASGNPFKPTTGQQYEGGIKFQPVGMNALITVAAFDLTEQNVLTVDPNNSAFNVQTGEIRSRGIEAEGKASLTEGLDLLGSFTYADVKVTKSNGTDLGKRPVNIPATVAKLWAFTQFKAGPFKGSASAAVSVRSAIRLAIRPIASLSRATRCSIRPCNMILASR